MKTSATIHKPTKSELPLGATNNRPPTAIDIRQTWRNGARKYADTAVAITNTPNAQVIDTCKNDPRVKYSGNTISMVGAYTNTMGTNNLPKPRLNALMPVRNGFAPAMPAAAYADAQTGGVISEITP